MYVPLSILSPPPNHTPLPTLPRLAVKWFLFPSLLQRIFLRCVKFQDRGVLELNLCTFFFCLFLLISTLLSIHKFLIFFPLSFAFVQFFLQKVNMSSKHFNDSLVTLGLSACAAAVAETATGGCSGGLAGCVAAEVTSEALEWASDQGGNGGGFTGAAYSAIKAATTYDSDY